jgi:UDP-N-acetylglucosamine 2-epimerase (non-hydrolysing)
VHALMRRLSFVLSDSDSLQEDVTAPSIGCFSVVLRTSTERPEAVEAGYAKVMGFDTRAICAGIEAKAGKGRPSQEHPYGTGDAARRVVDALEDFLGRQPPSS